MSTLGPCRNAAVQGRCEIITAKRVILCQDIVSGARSSPRSRGEMRIRMRTHRGTFAVHKCDTMSFCRASSCSWPRREGATRAAATRATVKKGAVSSRGGRWWTSPITRWPLARYRRNRTADCGRSSCWRDILKRETLSQFWEHIGRWRR